MKRIAAMLMVIAMILGVLTGCGGVVVNKPAGSEDAADGADSSSAAVGSDELSKPAQALEGAEVVISLGHDDNDISMLENTWNCYARTFKKQIEIYSGGTMTVDIFPNGQLGSTTSMLEQVSSGALDMEVSAALGALAGWVPNASVFDIPYLVDDQDVCNLVCEGAIKDELSEDLIDAANMRIISMLQTDFRNLDTWKAPVKTVSDLKGQKMRVQEIEPHIAMVEAWGAAPTSVAFTELYTAASTGVIDCYENCNYTLFMNNLYETVKYITETRHAANVCVAVMNQDTWESLSEEQQDIVTRAAADARRATIGTVTACNVSRMSELESAGIEIISLSDEERAEFADACFEEAKAAAMTKIDADFFDRFTAAYDAAAEILGS